MEILSWSRVVDTLLKQGKRYSVVVGLEQGRRYSLGLGLGEGQSRVKDTRLEQGWRYSVGAGLEILGYSRDGSGLELQG